MKDGEEEIVYAVDYNHKKERQEWRGRERESGRAYYYFSFLQTS